MKNNTSHTTAITCFHLIFSSLSFEKPVSSLWQIVPSNWFQWVSPQLKPSQTTPSPMPRYLWGDHMNISWFDYPIYYFTFPMMVICCLFHCIITIPSLVLYTWEVPNECWIVLSCSPTLAYLHYLFFPQPLHKP